MGCSAESVALPDPHRGPTGSRENLGLSPGLLLSHHDLSCEKNMFIYICLSTEILCQVAFAKTVLASKKNYFLGGGRETGNKETDASLGWNKEPFAPLSTGRE